MNELRNTRVTDVLDAIEEKHDVELTAKERKMLTALLHELLPHINVAFVDDQPDDAKEA